MVGSAQQNQFDSYLLDAIAAVVVGGTSLYDFTLYDVQMRLYSENHLVAMPQVRMLRHTLVRKADAEQ